ncbi:hypothetical protein ACGFX4_12080, partial [Kitasatospora sp. NPDC048365]
MSSQPPTDQTPEPPEQPDGDPTRRAATPRPEHDATRVVASGQPTEVADVPPDEDGETGTTEVVGRPADAVGDDADEPDERDERDEGDEGTAVTPVVAAAEARPPEREATQVADSEPPDVPGPGSRTGTTEVVGTPPVAEPTAVADVPGGGPAAGHGETQVAGGEPTEFAAEPPSEPGAGGPVVGHEPTELAASPSGGPGEETEFAAEPP